MNKRIYLIILYIATLLICFAALSHHLGRAVSGCGSCVADSVSFGSYTVLSGKNIDKSYTEKNFTELRISGSVSNIEIREGSEYAVSFKGDSALEPTLSLKDKTLTIRQPSKNIPGNSADYYSLITVVVPHNALEKVDINASVGDVTINGVSCEDLIADLSVGTITVADVQASNKTRIKASVGEIVIGDSKTGKLNLDSSVGSIRLSYVESEDADIDSAIGDVRIDGLDADNYNIEVSCSLGDFQYNGREYGKKEKIRNINADHTIKVDSEIGSVSINTK